jgi:hypothetical protein
MPVGSVWQPAKKRSAAAKKTGFARKIDIFQDRHLLSSATRAIAGFFLHQPVALVIWCQMLELEVYAAGHRDLDKILELDHQLAAIPGLRYKVDRNHHLVYLELDQPTITFREIRAIFRELALDPRFVGAIPAELRPKTKTQPLGV